MRYSKTIIIYFAIIPFLLITLSGCGYKADPFYKETPPKAKAQEIQEPKNQEQKQNKAEIK